VHHVESKAAGSEKSGKVSVFAKRAARSLSRRLREFGEVEPEGFDLENIPNADIALYFPDQPAKLYQLLQWLPVFENHTELRTIVVVRNLETYNELRTKTSLQVLLVPRYEILMALYDRADFHAVIYVNNGWTNFQSLSFQQAVHIHVNHGESDKICMVSNQAKAYDKVYVAGQAAIDRHAAAIAWFDPSHLVRVGRPQLDLDIASPIAKSELVTITYAPTWEGEDEVNNYTSVDLYGPEIVQAALAIPHTRLVYKPHPRVLESADPLVRANHKKIVNLISSAGAPHVYLPNANILGILPETDLLIADVSSVTLDYLYLTPNSPILLTDRRSNPTQLLTDSPMSAVCAVVDQNSISRIGELITTTLDVDSHRDDRARMRTYYFGDTPKGTSTQAFWSAIRSEIAAHDTALNLIQRVRQVQP
jgi:hypothetical protein